MNKKSGMKKFILNTVGTAFIISAMLTQFVYAESVITAASPTVASGATAASTAGTGGQNVANQSQGPGYSNQTESTGSSGTASLSGYQDQSDASGVGPGFNNTSQDADSGKESETSTGSQGVETGTTQPETSAQTSDASSSQSGAQDTSSQIVIDTSIAKPEIKSDYAILYDGTINQVLYEKNADTPLPPASTAKLVAAMVVLEQFNQMNTTITFQQSVIDSLEVGATTARMSAGDTLTVEQALNAMLVGSACDVASQLATSLAGSETTFAALMTQKAISLGCTSTNFVNASGLNSDAQYTTPRDMAKITYAAISNDTISTILLKQNYTLPATSSRGALTLKNTNHFTLGKENAPAGYMGGKTGYTSKAGQCLATMAEINGHRLVVVILHSTTPNQYDDSYSLYEYGKKILEAAGIVATGSSSTTTTTNESTADSTASQSTLGTEGSWEQTSEGMKYRKQDGTYYTSEWLDLDGNTYFFGPDGIMCTGWQRFANDTYYYFDPNNGGAMVKSKWVTTEDGKSYYMSQTGAMATNTVIDGTYRVDENGLYVGRVQ